jgi:hypothetical protein
MNDVEHDLRDLFDRKASSVGGVAPRLPDAVRKRSRRREIGTALVSGLTVLALVVGSVAVVRSLDVGGRDRTVVDDPWAGYQVFERTATIETITLTSPSDWYLVNQWPLSAGTVADNDPGSQSCEISIPPGQESAAEACQGKGVDSARDGSPTVLPLALLSATDLGLGTSPCLDGGVDLTSDEALLEVAIDREAVDRMESGEDLGLPAWPVPFDEAVTPGPCGEGRYARFQVGRYPYVAFLGAGPSATEADRAALISLASDMHVDPQAFVQGTRERLPAYVVAGGESAAGSWRLELRPSSGKDGLPSISLGVVSAEGTVGLGDVVLDDEHPIEQAGGDPVFGAVVEDATGVALRLEEGTPPIPAQVVPLPPSMPFGFDLFFASNDADIAAVAVPIFEGQETTDSVAISDTVTRQVLAEGPSWLLVLESRDQQDLIWFEARGEDRFAPLPVRPTPRGRIGRWQVSGIEDEQLLVYGLVAPDIDRLRLTTDDGEVVEARPIELIVDGVEAFALSYRGSSGVEGQLDPALTLDALDRNGEVISSQRIPD